MFLSEQHKTSAPSHHVGLSVYSPLGAEGLEAVESHTRRARAMHEALANVLGIEVTHWGATDAPQPQWLVQLLVMLTPPLALPLRSSEPFVALRRALAAGGTADDQLDAVVAFASHLRTFQATAKLGAFELNLPDGNRVRCEPHGSGAELIIRSVAHDPVTISYGRTV